MSELEYYFKRILKKQEEIGYRMVDFLNKGLTTDDISLFELKHGIKLNDEFRDYFTLCNGVHDSTTENWKLLNILPSGYEFVSIEIVDRFVNEKYFEQILEAYDVNYLSMHHLPIIDRGVPDTL